MRVALLLVFALGCAGRVSDSFGGSSGAAGVGGVGGVAGVAGLGGAGGAGGTGDAGGSDSGLDADVVTGAGGDASVAVTWPLPCSDIYDPNVLQTFELTFSAQEWNGVQNDCDADVQRYRPVQVTHNGVTVSAMARLKGNWSWNCQKMQFVVSFNETDPNGRFHGVRKLVFDAPWYDRTLLHERLASPIFERRGLPYSCVNSARVVINGEYYGLFTNVERIDKEYLQRNFEASGGNLYQAGVELKTNELVNDQRDIEALRAARTVGEIDALMDLDEAVAEWATEAMLPALDNYWAGVEINYYLYNHPTRGFLYLPYDLDIVFGDSAMQNGDLIWPDAVMADPITYEHNQWLKEDLLKRVLADATWCRRFVDELVLARDAYSPTELSGQVDTMGAQIAQAVADDTNKTFTTAEHQAALVSIKTFFGARASFVDQWLANGASCPANW